jgi:hypothetical protein
VNTFTELLGFPFPIGRRLCSWRWILANLWL